MLQRWVGHRGAATLSWTPSLAGCVEINSILPAFISILCTWAFNTAAEPPSVQFPTNCTAKIARTGRSTQPEATRVLMNHFERVV